MLGLGNSLATGGTSSDERLPSDPPLDTTLALWLRNGEGVTAAQWSDSSGNNNHITQSTGGEQATVTEGGLQFEGDNNDHYDLTTPIDIGDSNPWTIFIVLNIQSYDSPDAGSPNCILGVSASANDRFLEMQNADQIRYRQSGTAAVLKFAESGHFPLDEKYLITIRKDSSSELFVYKNGSLLTQDSSLGNPVASGDFLADQFGGRSSGPDRDFDGTIYEFILYEADVTGTDLTDIHGYLNNYHGLA